MRIPFPSLKYRQALAEAKVTSLKIRRDHLNQRVWKNISAKSDFSCTVSFPLSVLNASRIM